VASFDGGGRGSFLFGIGGRGVGGSVLGGWLGQVGVVVIVWWGDETRGIWKVVWGRKSVLIKLRLSSGRRGFMICKGVREVEPPYI